MKRHRSLLLSTSALTFVTALGVFMPHSARASCLTVSSDTTITDSSVSCINWTGGNLSIAGSGLISGSNTGVLNSSSSLATLTNSGSISAIYGISNAGTIAAINNSGTINSNQAISNGSGALINLISLSGLIGGSTGIANGGTIATINNSGTIGNSWQAISNGTGAMISLISNSGLISQRIDNSGTIETINNSGTISSAYHGINNNGGTIETINNSGTISGAGNSGINNSGTIGTIINSGVISGGTFASAINSNGTILSALSNSGTISGSLNVSQVLTITGGSAGSLGTLTGYNGAPGTITATNLVFDSGAHQLLDDDVVVGSGSGTVTNNGALQINGAHSISGNYIQASSTTLTIGATNSTIYGQLTISGAATMTNDVIDLTALSGSFSNGETFTVAQASSSGTDYSGITASAGAGFTANISSIVGGGLDDLVISLAIDCQNVTSNTTVSTSIACVSWAGGNLSIASNGVIIGANTGVLNSGNTLGTLTNSGSITGTKYGVYNNGGTISTINNNLGGEIYGVTNAGINNVSGSITTITNNGTITGYSNGIINYNGAINRINNYGVISGPNGAGIWSPGGSIGTIENESGATILGNNFGIYNNGTITTILNNGVMSGSATQDLFNDASGTIGALTNNGTISGAPLGITNSGTIGILTNSIGGTIGASSAAIKNSGSISSIVNALGASINGGTVAILNTGGTIGTINNVGIITGGSSGGIYNFANSSIGTVTNSGTIFGAFYPGVLNDGTINAIINSGYINSGGAGIGNNGDLGSIVNSGTIYGGGTYYGINNEGSLTAIINQSGGLITSSDGAGIWNGAGTIATISNAAMGSITGLTGISNDSTISTILNSGTISGNNNGIYNSNGSIGLIDNSGTINGSVGSFTYAAIYNNGGTIGTITNNGKIGVSQQFDIANSGTINTINNNGVIGISNSGWTDLYNTGGITNIDNASTGIINAGIWNNGGTIGTISNAGQINNGTGSDAILNTGEIGTISNSGTVISNDSAISNNSTIGTILNSGTINGNIGIYNSGLIGDGATAIDSSTGTIIGGITNSGTISGNILVNQALTISGSIGTLTGGMITTNNHDLVFANGSNQVLGDAINVGATNTASVAGTLQVNAPISITGNYIQTGSGLLDIGVTDSSNHGELSISGNATITSGIVSISGTLSNGEVLTIAQAASAGSDYAGVLVDANGFLATASSIIGGGIDSLVVTLSACSNQAINSDTTFSSSACGLTWNAGNLSITSSGLVAGSNTGILNSSSTVGSLTNSGKITGLQYAIYNNSGSIASLNNESDGIIYGQTGINNTGNIGVIGNSGTISGTHNGIKNSGIIETIGNMGLISSNSSGVINNTGSIGTLSNSGILQGTAGNNGIQNSGTIGLFSNSSVGTLSASSGIQNSGGTIGTILNAGLIFGINDDGIYAGGSIGTITNNASGTISGRTGISDFGSIGTIANSGLIQGSSYVGILVEGGASTVNAIYNNIGGTIVGNSSGISNYGGTIVTITNSGLIKGPNAIYVGTSSSTIGTILSAISNAGTIAGNINVQQALTITGGSIGGLGTLTGYNGTIGTITTNNNDLTFDANAYQLLDDDINVGASNTVINNGRIRVNTTHSITGNYSQGAAATLVVGVTDSSHYGNLVISGTATMTNSNVLIAPTTGSLSNGETFTIVQAAGTANYTGVSATASGFTATTSTASIGGYNDLIIALSSGSSGGGGNSGGGSASNTYATLGQSAGGVGGSVGRALDRIQTLVASGGQAAFAPILTALNTLGATQGSAKEGAAIKQLAPSQLAPQISTNNLTANQTMDVISQHQTTLLEDHGTGNTGRAAGSEYRSGVLWMQVDGGFANQSSTASAVGYHQNFYGMTFGVDAPVTNNANVGMAVSWMHSAANGSDNLSGDTVTTSTPELMAYGSYRMGHAFVDGLLGIGYNMFNQNRNIGFLDKTATASYGGMQYMGSAEVGYDFNVTPRTVMTPLLGFNTTRTDTNGYTETGAGAADVSVGRQIIESYASSLGGRVATEIPTKLGALTPDIKLAWVHNLNNGAINTNATMAGVSFTTATPRSSPDGAHINLGATLQYTDDLSLRAEYDGDIHPDFQSHTGILKGEWKF